jgi:carbon monoxide dehydrogenase subunit G
MEFSNEFTVHAPMERVWAVLTDAQQVAPCVPGAEITEVIDERHFKGQVKVKLGAVSVSYRGEMEMEADPDGHTITLRGKGTEARGSGGASGSMQVRLQQEGDAVHVYITSQVDVTGRIATFGRGIMQDVSNRLIKEFASCVQGKIESGTGPETDHGDSRGAGSAASSKDTEPQEHASVAAQPGQGQAAPVAAPAPSPPLPRNPEPTRSGGAEVNLTALMRDVIRSRVAEGLRAIASRIEPH